MWVLVILFLIGDSGVYQVEFGSQKACTDAKTVISSSLVDPRSLKMFCFPKD